MKDFTEPNPKLAFHRRRRNIGFRLVEHDTAGLVREVFCKACRKEPAEKGVTCNGIYPRNKSISDNLDFLPSQAKNIPRTTGVNTVDD